MRRIIPPILFMLLGLAVFIGAAAAQTPIACSGVVGDAHYLAGPGAGKPSPLEAVSAAFDKIPLDSATQITVTVPPEVPEDEEEILIVLLVEDDVFYVAQRDDGFVLARAVFCNGVVDE